MSRRPFGVASAEAVMPALSDFFAAEPQNWRDRLAVSTDLMRALSRHTDPHELYKVFAGRMDELFPVNRRLTLSRRGLREPHYRVTQFNLWTDAANPWTEPHRLPVHAGGVLAEVLYGGEPRLVPDLTVPADDPAADYLAGQRSMLVIPFYEDGEVVNAVVLCRDEADAFPPDRIPDLVMLSNLFGRATHTLAQAQGVRDAYAAIDFEMRTVADIQRALLPTSTPRVPGLDVAVDYRPAQRAGGDYYDFFSLPGGRLGVLIADASGHGAPAAVLMAMTHSITHTLPAPVRPGELLTHLNAHLARRYTRPTGYFVTAFYAVFDPAAATLTYASAGHSPPRLARAGGGGRFVLNRAQRLPLGIEPDEVYPEQTVAFHPGDRVIFFTDGVIEAVDPGGDMYGTDPIDGVLATAPASAAALLGAVLDSWAAFTAGAPPADDRTLVVVERAAADARGA